MVAKKAAFLLNDGSVVGMDGTSEILIPNGFTQNVYVVVYHRNHIRIMSSNALTQTAGIYTYDFTDNVAKAYNSGQKPVGSVAAMYSADIDNDGNVFVSDFTIFQGTFTLTNAYHNADLDMDGSIFVSDLNHMSDHFTITTSIP
jgi:hypothetical protein